MAPFLTRRHRKHNALRMQGREVPDLAHWTMGIRSTTFVVVKIQCNRGLNAGKAEQQQYSDNEAVALPALRHSHGLAEYTNASFRLDARF